MARARSSNALSAAQGSASRLSPSWIFGLFCSRVFRLLGVVGFRLRVLYRFQDLGLGFWVLGFRLRVLGFRIYQFIWVLRPRLVFRIGYAGEASLPPHERMHLGLTDVATHSPVSALILALRSLTKSLIPSQAYRPKKHQPQPQPQPSQKAPKPRTTEAPKLANPGPVQEKPCAEKQLVNMY